MKPFDFIVFVLATYRATKLFTEDEGPFQVFLRLRMWALRNAHKNIFRQTFSDAIHCPFCLSVWITPFMLFVPKRIRELLAVAGAVYLVEHFVQRE